MLFSYVPFGVTVMVLGCPDYLQFPMVECWFFTGGFEFVRLVESVGKLGIPLFFGLLVFVSLGSVSSLSELTNVLKETHFSTTCVNFRKTKNHSVRLLKGP
jgi:hypothetical protein